MMARSTMDGQPMVLGADVPGGEVKSFLWACCMTACLAYWARHG